MRRRDILRTATASSLGLATGMALAAPAAARQRKALPEVDAKDGTRLFLRDWGEGKPIVFLHGWALASDMWAYQMAPLVADGFRCIAYDRRGHGRSSDPGRGYDYDTLAGDLAAVLEDLDLEDVTLVAHSMATGEMVRYLTRYGGRRASRLVFVSTAATPGLAKSAENPDGIHPAYFENMRRNVFLQDFPKMIDDGAAAFFMPDTSPGIINWTRQMMLQTSMLAVVECNRAMTDADFREELRAIEKPSLIIHGTKDASAPVEMTGKPTAGMIRGAEFALYEDGPHGLYYTHRARLNADIKAFASS